MIRTCILLWTHVKILGTIKKFHGRQSRWLILKKSALISTQIQDGYYVAAAWYCYYLVGLEHSLFFTTKWQRRGKEARGYRKRAAHSFYTTRFLLYWSAGELIGAKCAGAKTKEFLRHPCDSTSHSHSRAIEDRTTIRRSARAWGP